MFSVNNFYDFVYSNYGPDRTNNFILAFHPHGSKDLHNLETLVDNPNNRPNFNTRISASSRIVMHDQEPLFLDYLNTYRFMLQHRKNLLYSSNQIQLERIEQLSKYSKDLSNIDFFKRAISGNNSPIICHSELNSEDIAILEENNFITCYYWWHGMIARDWFRHWQHYDILMPTNKAANAERFLLYSRAFDGTRVYRQDLVEHCKKFETQIKYNWNGVQVDSTFSAKIDINDSGPPIHIVAETLFDTNKIYLTEKVFKPMVMSQAFILFAPPGSLQYLRDYGFKTFDCCWDESYDLEPDSTVRMSKLLQLISNLATMSQELFEDLYQRALPVIRHNRQRFFDMAFQDDLISEMRTNMNTALLKQNQRH